MHIFVYFFQNGFAATREESLSVFFSSTEGRHLYFGL